MKKYAADAIGAHPYLLWFHCGQSNFLPLCAERAFFVWTVDYCSAHSGEARSDRQLINPPEVALNQWRNKVDE